MQGFSGQVFPFRQLPTLTREASPFPDLCQRLDPPSLPASHVGLAGVSGRVLLALRRAHPVKSGHVHRVTALIFVLVCFGKDCDYNLANSS